MALPGTVAADDEPPPPPSEADKKREHSEAPEGGELGGADAYGDEAADVGRGGD